MIVLLIGAKNGALVNLAKPGGKHTDKERLINEVPVLEIELVASSLCIHHVLTNNENPALPTTPPNGSTLEQT